jgi:hypothetical protein
MKLKYIAILVFIILISITFYKLTGQGSTIDPKQPQTSLEVQSPQKVTIPNDPFKEVLEKQSQLKEGQQTQNKPFQGVPNKDPFKEFLEKQAKDLSQSKVSPFDSPAGK